MYVYIYIGINFKYVLDTSSINLVQISILYIYYSMKPSRCLILSLNSVVLHVYSIFSLFQHLISGVSTCRVFFLSLLFYHYSRFFSLSSQYARTIRLAGSPTRGQRFYQFYTGERYQFSPSKARDRSVVLTVIIIIKAQQTQVLKRAIIVQIKQYSRRREDPPTTSKRWQSPLYYSKYRYNFYVNFWCILVVFCSKIFGVFLYCFQSAIFWNHII